MSKDIRSKIASNSIGSALRPYITTFVSLIGWKIALALGLMILVGLTEGIGLLMLVPLLQLVGLDVQQGTIGQLARLTSSAFAAAGVRPTLVAVLIVYVSITVIQALLNRWQTVTNFTLEQQFVTNLRRLLYRAITNTNWLFFSRSRASDFTHGLTTELDRVGTATYYLVALTANAIVSAAYILLALRLSAVMTGLVLACGSALLLLFRGKMRAAHRSGEALSEATSGLYASAIEHLSGMKTVKSYGAQDRNIAIFSRLTERVQHTYSDAVRNQAGVKLWFDIGSVLVLSLILFIMLKVLAVPTAGIFLLLFLFARIIPRISSMQQSLHQLVNTLPSFANIIEMQTRCEAAVEPRPARSEQVRFRDSIRFEQVSFAYEQGGSPLVICGLDMVIRAGETTAIVGPSGAGKSTLADLVMGLIAPGRGRVLVDDTAIDAERMRSWRDQIGYVAQDTFLFNDTVLANLRWACPDANDEEIKQALRLAAAEEFVYALPDGMETILGDCGVRLSGGERQRLALARALLRKPSLLILDEATSALDSENEKRIQSAIEQLHGYMTILIITHRLSTVREADVIHVLEQGSLVEYGDWDMLIAKEEGRFRALCRAQNIEVMRSYF